MFSTGMCGWHLHAFNTWEVSLSNLTVSSGLLRWHAPWEDEITTSHNDLPHEYSIKSRCQISFVSPKLLAYWESFGPFFASAPVSFCQDVYALPVMMGSPPLPALVPLSFPTRKSVGLLARSRELVHQTTCNLCDIWKATLGTWPQVILWNWEQLLLDIDNG